MRSTLLRGGLLLALLALPAAACGGNVAAESSEALAAAALVDAPASPAGPAPDELRRPSSSPRPPPTEDHSHAADKHSPAVDDRAETADGTAPSSHDPPAASPSATPRPEWLGTHLLADRWSDIAPAQETPPELRDRRLLTPEGLAPPYDEEFRATVEAVPEEVAARSTWRPECPVALEQLRYVTVTFWGFDGRHHTGELIANAAAADDLVTAFARLHAERFPIEELRVIAAGELDAPRTGDGNVTTVFVCRNATQSQSWSQHAYGLAIDINPFHNPYLKGDVVRPEFATAYTDRDWVRSGMITRGDVVTQAFAEIGWTWGGDWGSLKDWMHFSASGR